MSLGRATLTVGGLTALSRVAGFGRDLLIAAALGAGPVADAFFVSLKLANFLRRLFAEGAFGAAFVPLYGRWQQRGGRAAAGRFAGEALAVLAVALAVAVALGELGMPWLVRLLATGFAPGTQRYELSVELARVTFPYLLLISLAALFSGILQSHGRFAAAAFAPVLLNLVLIAVLLIARPEGAHAARLLAWGVVVAGVMQLAWVAAAAGRADVAPPWRAPRLSPEVRRLLRRTGPGVLGIGVVQLNLLVASWFATHLPPGTVAYLFYADRLIQLPVGIVGVALGTALLPALSVPVRPHCAAHDVLNRALDLALLLGLPAAVGLGMLAQPITAVLFERGAFGPEAARATAQVLAGLSLGLPAAVLAKVLAPGLYARGDTATPVKVAAVALAVNVAAAAWLTPALGHTGLALSLSLSSWINVLGLVWLLAKHGQLRPDALVLRRGVGTLAAVAVMAGMITLVRDLLPGAAAGLALTIALGGLSFLVVACAGGAVDLLALRRLAGPSRA